MKKIENYIDWKSIWEDEVKIDRAIKTLTGRNKFVCDTFVAEVHVELLPSECMVEGEMTSIFFAFRGVEWNYWFVVYSHSYQIADCGYYDKISGR